MMKFKAIGLFVILGCSLVGCTPTEEEPEANGTPPPQRFEGSIDKRLVGIWTNPDGSQKLTMKEDGSAAMTGFVNTPGGKKELNEAMEWKADATKLSFKMKDGAVQKYAFSLDKNELLLKTAKTSTVYKKSK